MRKHIYTTLASTLIVLGILIFTPTEIKAGDPGSQNGNNQNSFQYCLGQTGDTAYYRSKPSNCKCTTAACRGGVSTGVATIESTGTAARGRKSDGTEREANSRQTSSALLSTAVLLVGLGLALLSARKWVRLAFGAPVRQSSYGWKTPLYSRALGFAAIIAMLGLGAGAWLSARSTRASVYSPGNVPNASRAQAQPAAAVPTFSSARQIGGPGFVEVAGTAVDKQGNTYIAGGFNGEITFNTVPQPTTLTSSESYDVFVAKYNSAGEPLWSRMANGATGLTFTDPATGAAENFSFDGALSLAVDAQGNAYVGGGFVESLSFKDASGNAVATLGDNNSDINFELFVAKYDTNGTLVWARGGMSGAPDDKEGEHDLDSAVNGVTEIVVDKSGNPYVAGTFSGTNFLGQAVTTAGGRDVILARLNPATGAPIWVSLPGSTGTDAAMGMAIDDSANIYLIGDMGGTITFPTQPVPTSLILDDEFGDSFVAKYDKDGHALWAKQIGGNQPIAGEHVAVSGAGQLYLTGAFEGTADFDSITVTDLAGGSGSSGFLAKYTTDGNALWVRPFGHTTGENPDGEVIGHRVSVDGAGDPYVFGTFEGEATFGFESPATAQTLTSGEAEDKFIAHYDAAGNFMWVKHPDESGSAGQSGFASKDTPIEIVPMRLIYNEAAKAMILSGSFDGALTLDSVKLTSDTGRHAFLATLPLSQAPTAPSIVQFSSANYPVGEGSGQVQITVTRTGDTSNAATIDYATSDGTASQKGDYQLSVGTLSFAPGETSKTFVELLVDDSFVEGVETINLALSNPTGTAIGSISTASVTVTDNDVTQPTTNPYDDAQYFVHQNYFDFLGREPDSGGLAYWTAQITQCGSDQACIRRKRIDVSDAFLFEAEYQQTGAYVFRLFRAAYGNNQPSPNPDNSNTAEAKKLPSYAAFAQDRARIIGGSGLAQSQIDLANQLVQRAEFLAKYSAALTDAQFVDALLAGIKTDSGADLTSQRDALITLSSQSGRGAVLYRLANEDGTAANGGVNNRAFIDAEYNRAFVFSQYTGYLRRDADIGGFLFWLSQVNRYPLRDLGGQHAMVCSFITSKEYQLRFSPVESHTNQECPQ